MLSVGEACLLGVVQGVTEFLPVSSSGHLAIVHHIIEPPPADQMAAIDVALHLGTLAAVVAYFRRDLVAMARASVRREPSWERRWVAVLALGSVPAGMFGLAAREAIHASFASLATVGLCLLATGLLLVVAQRVAPRHGRGPDEVGMTDALVVGCFQALALFPGISRSGATIAGGMLRGVDRMVAAKFSFLLGIPAIVGAQLSEARTLATLPEADLVALAAGTAVSGVSGLLAIGVLMRLVRSDRLHYFAFYLWPLGLVVIGAALAEGW